MSITHIRAAVVGVIVGAAVPAALFLGAATAQAAPDLSGRPSHVGFDPQPEPPGYGDPHKLGSIRGFDPRSDPPGISSSLKLGP